MMWMDEVWPGGPYRSVWKKTSPGNPRIKKQPLDIDKAKRQAGSRGVRGTTLPPSSVVGTRTGCLGPWILVDSGSGNLCPQNPVCPALRSVTRV